MDAKDGECPRFFVGEVWSTTGMASVPVRLTERQLEVLRWVGDGCPARDWPDESHKLTARAMSYRGLLVVGRKQKVWTATITGVGRFFLDHGYAPPESAREPELNVRPQRTRSARWSRPTVNLHGKRAASDGPGLDATARAMRRVATRVRPSGVVQKTREIRETYVRYKVVVTRVQVAERFVRATSEEDAAKKVQEEFDRPYGYFGSWKTVSSEVDVVEAEQTTVIGQVNLSNAGPLLLSVKDAAKALGISYSTLYQMMNQGDIEWVNIGSRKFLAREALMDFIKANSHKGYYTAR
jgi:excisionase family DNA binding protein